MHRNPFIDFVHSERGRYADSDNNRLALAAGQASRYYDYLSVILDRYAEADKAFREEHSRLDALSRAHPDGYPTSELERSAQFRCALHLEIESFYVFAKTLLDKATHLILLYFGPARGCRLKSHHDLLKCWQQYYRTKKLDGAQNLIDMMTRLQSNISDFRDKKLTHQNNPRVTLGTAFPDEQGAYLSAGYFYPKPSDEPYQSLPLGSLMADLDRYIDTLLACVTVNREHTALQPKE